MHIMTTKLVVSSTSRSMIIAVVYTQLHYMKLKPQKNSGLNGIWTHDLCNMGAVLYQLNHQDNWELLKMLLHNIPIDGEECKQLYEKSYIWIAEKDTKI